MAKRIKFGLSVKEVNDAIAEIRFYQNDLKAKCETLTKMLAEEGIAIAQAYIGDSSYGKYIHLQSYVSYADAGGCKAIFYLADTEKIHSTWKTIDGEKTAEVSPSLMLEFGAGLPAKNPKNIPGVGTGTFPGGTHGNDPHGWYWLGMDDVWHHSYGYSPKMPMYYAGKDLRTRVVEVAGRVFV